ncbi:MAG: 5-bromo-4-chloroindolyl phosphate hydrolysis family protein [Pseudomonadota bacterium]
MAQRFGGRYSPNGQSNETSGAPPPRAGFAGRAPARHGAKINILFVTAAITVAASLFQPILTLAIDLSGSAALLLGAWLTRDGVRAEDAYNERKVARRPAIPRKIFGSVLTGVGVALLAFGGQWLDAIAPAALAGVLAGGLHLFVFGPDPMRDKGLEGVDTAQTDRVARKIEAAETLLDEMKDAALRARDRALDGRVERFQATAREMFRTIEGDPRDLTRARRYLGVYLQGARDATVKYADIAARGGDPAARDDYLALLDDLERGFSERTKALLLDDRSDLDVEIEVLRERLDQDIRQLDQRG